LTSGIGGEAAFLILLAPQEELTSSDTGMPGSKLC
jgi:hypothetical protein